MLHKSNMVILRFI